MEGALDLRRVQKGRGRIHLTAVVRPGEPVRTLCGRELPAGSSREVEAAPDCGLCIRRSRDPAAVSGAFFAGDEGERVLELAIEAARSRRRERSPAEPRRPGARAAPVPPPAEAPEPAPPAAEAGPGELDRRGLREFADGVYLAPAGAIVRLAGERVAEVVGEGRFQIVRRGRRIRIRAAGIVVEGEVSDLHAQADPEER